MAFTSTPILPAHRELNAQRRLLADQPDLSSIASPAAQRLLFTSLLDHLATVPPLVAVDGLIDDDLARVISTVLDGEPRDLDTTPADLFDWLEPTDDEALRRYSLRLVQFCGRLLDRYGDPKHPPHPVGALHELVPLLPAPSVLELSLDGAMQRFTPSVHGREILGWTGTVCIPAGAYA